MVCTSAFALAYRQLLLLKLNAICASGEVEWILVWFAFSFQLSLHSVTDVSSMTVRKWLKFVGKYLKKQCSIKASPPSLTPTGSPGSQTTVDLDCRKFPPRSYDVSVLLEHHMI